MSENYYEYFDISPTLGPDTPAWPTDPPVVFTHCKSVEAGNSSNVTGLEMCSHAGSHIDAPRHLFSAGLSVDLLPAELLIGPAVVIETEAENIDADFLISAWPNTEVIRLLFKTTNSLLWSSPFRSGFVGLTADAADYIVERGVRLVGIDYLSIEAEHGVGAPVHRKLLENQVCIVESLDLSEVDPGFYELICLPLKLDGLDGAPARVVLRRPVGV